MSIEIESDARPTVMAVGDDPFPATFTTCGDVAFSHRGNRLVIAHRLSLDTISDDTVVAAVLRLVDAGVLRGQPAFEHAVVELICSVTTDEMTAWAAFYDNSIHELRSGTAAFAPVHHRARGLVRGHTVLEVGSCFGFFALQCAQDGHRVTACDISGGAVELLASAARRRDLDVTAIRADATDLPLANDAVDTVTLIHLLEHLDEHSVDAAIAEALRVARLRVVIAVPFEEHPSEHFGHLLQLTTDDLRRWARRAGQPDAEIAVDHGGWLTLSAAPAGSPQIRPRLLAV